MKDTVLIMNLLLILKKLYVISALKIIIELVIIQLVCNAPKDMYQKKEANYVKKEKKKKENIMEDNGAPYDLMPFNEKSRVKKYVPFVAKVRHFDHTIDNCFNDIYFYDYCPVFKASTGAS